MSLASDSPAEKGEITRLLLQWRDGREDALETLIPLVYDELRQLAHNYMYREQEGHLLETTALVHEAYLRLVDLEADWRDRHHFFALVARLMRRILVDLARRRQAEKRGGDRPEVSLEAALQVPATDSGFLLHLDDALNRLAEHDERKSKVLELQFFGGLTAREIADVLAISTATVERDLKMARAWLARELEPTPSQ